jgi:hypothetical protein
MEWARWEGKAHLVDQKRKLAGAQSQSSRIANTIAGKKAALAMANSNAITTKMATIHKLRGGMLRASLLFFLLFCSKV